MFSFSLSCRQHAFYDYMSKPTKEKYKRGNTTKKKEIKRAFLFVLCTDKSDRWQFTNIWGIVFSAKIYMTPVTKMMKMGFLCGPSSTALQSTLGHKNLPWSLSVGKWLSSRLTLPTRKCCCQRINN